MTSSGSSRLMPRLMVSDLRATPGTARGRHAEMAGERGAERRAGGRDLVLGLERADAEVLVLRQLVEDVGRGRDRVRAQEHRQLRELTGGDHTPRERGVARDVRVRAGRELGRLHLIGVSEQLGRLAEVVTGFEGSCVRREDLRRLREPLLDPRERGVDRPGVHPRHEAEREEVLRPVGVTRLDAERRGRLLRERGHRHLVHRVALETAVAQRVRRVARLREVALVERVDVHDEGAAGLEPIEVGLQGGGVHRDEHARGVARSGDLVVGDVDLERRDAGQGAGRSTDLGGKLGERRQVVAEQRARAREPVASELHAVARVAGESDDHPMQLFGQRLFCGVGHGSPLGRAWITSM